MVKRRSSVEATHFMTRVAAFVVPNSEVLKCMNQEMLSSLIKLVLLLEPERLEKTNS